MMCMLGMLLSVKDPYVGDMTSPLDIKYVSKFMKVQVSRWNTSGIKSRSSNYRCDR